MLQSLLQPLLFLWGQATERGIALQRLLLFCWRYIFVTAQPIPRVSMFLRMFLRMSLRWPRYLVLWRRR